MADPGDNVPDSTSASGAARDEVAPGPEDFAAFYLIIQFGFLFWFLSRPRKYVVTPDDKQIGMSFADCKAYAAAARAYGLQEPGWSELDQLQEIGRAHV